MKTSYGKLLAGAMAAAAFAQQPTWGGPGDVDLSFDSGSGISGDTSAIAPQSDGKLIIGGAFSTVKGLVRPGIARLNPDGSGDASFNPRLEVADLGGSFYSYVYSVVLQPNGKVLVGGWFSAADGARRGIARLNADGSLDASFNPGAGVDVEVLSIALQSDGKVVIGGQFRIVNGVSRNRVARLNPDGTLDTSFDSGSGPDELIYSLALQPDGKVLLGGTFSIVNGTNRSRIARLNTDGSLDTSFNPGSGVEIRQPPPPSQKRYEARVSFVALQPDGKVLIAGWFTSINGTPRNGLARLNGDGSLDTTFNPSTAHDSWSVSSVALQPDGKVLIGGAFASVNGENASGVARLNADGSLDNSFIPTSGLLGPIVLQPDGNVLVGGPFSIARLHADGRPDITFNPSSGVFRSVGSLSLQADGRILVTGPLQRLNADGTLDASFSPPGVDARVGSGLTGEVRCVGAQPDGKLLIGGEFTTVGGTNRNGIARLNVDGSLDDSFIFNPGLEAGDWVRALALQPDGKVLIGGGFETLIRTNRNGTKEWGYDAVARLHVDGSRDTTFKPALGADFTVYTLLLQKDGKVLIGGGFNTLNGGRIMRLRADGSLDASFTPPIGPGPAIALQPDGKMIIVGSITAEGTATRWILARLDPDGTLDTSFNSGSGADDWVESVALEPNGKVLIGGRFKTVNGVSRRGIARLSADGSLDSSFDPGVGANWPGWISAVAMQPDSRILIAGQFTTVNGEARWGIARLHGDRPPLNITTAAHNIFVSWPSTWTGFSLQETADLGAPWTDAPDQPLSDGQQFRITIPTTTSPKYFRAKRM